MVNIIFENSLRFFGLLHFALVPEGLKVINYFKKIDKMKINKEDGNCWRKPDLREWTLGNVIKINILFESGMELKVEVCSVDEILVIISIEMIFKAKKLDKITYEESMCPFLKTCTFLTNTSVLLPFKKICCVLYFIYFRDFITADLYLQGLSAKLFLFLLTFDFFPPLNSYKQSFFPHSCLL